MARPFSCICADARIPGAYYGALGGRRADLLLSDPPYCLLTRRRKGGDLRDTKHRKIDRDPVLRFESVTEYRHFSETWLTAATRHLQPHAPLVLWTNFLGRQPLLDAAMALGYGCLWGEFVWAKRTTEARGNEQLLRVYETALVLQRAPAPAPAPSNPATVWAVVAGYDDEGEGDTWGKHPHHKPFGVLEPLLRSYSKPGDWVLDPFAGSGSIPAAALRLDRAAACIEQSPEWAARVTERLSKTPGAT